MSSKIFVSILLALGMLVSAAPANAAENPETPILDTADLFTAEEENYLTENFLNAYNNYDVVPVLETVPTLDGQDITNYSINRANELGVGDATKNNGIYILIVTEDRNARFETGTGITKIVPAVTTQNILDTTVFPEFKENNYVEGVINGVNGIGEAYQTGPVTTPTEATPTSDSVLKWFGIVIGILILAGIVTVITVLLVKTVKKKKEKELKAKEDAKAKAEYERQQNLNREITRVATVLGETNQILNATPPERETLILKEAQNYLHENNNDLNLKTRIIERVTAKIVDKQKPLYSGNLNPHWYPEFKNLDTLTINQATEVYKEDVKNAHVKYEEYLVRKEQERVIAERKAAEKREQEEQAEKFWDSLSHSQKSALKNASSRSRKEDLLKQYGATTGLDMNVILPIMFILYASSMSQPAYGSSGYSSDSSSSYSGSDYSSFTFGGGGFDGGGGGGGGSW